MNNSKPYTPSKTSCDKLRNARRMKDEIEAMLKIPAPKEIYTHGEILRVEKKALRTLEPKRLNMSIVSIPKGQDRSSVSDEMRDALTMAALRKAETMERIKAREARRKQVQHNQSIASKGGHASAVKDDDTIIDELRDYKHTPGRKAGITAAVVYVSGKLGYANPFAIWKRLRGKPKGTGIAGPQGPTAFYKTL